MQQKIKQKIQQAAHYFQGLTKREKIVLAGSGALLAVFLFVGGVVSPVMSLQAKLQKSVTAGDDKLRKVYELSSRIRGAQEKVRSGALSQSRDVTLFGFVEELAARLRVNDRIEYMKPVADPADAAREVVELKIRSVYQEDLINLLYDIEHSPYSMGVRRLDIKRVDKDSNLDVTIQVVRYG